MAHFTRSRMPLEFTCERSAFFGAIHKIQGVVDRKSTSNVLAHILVESKGDGEIALFGTDYDVTIQATIPAKVKTTGRSAINGKSLFDIVKNMDDGELTAKTLANDWTEVRAGRSMFKLAGIGAADYPEAVQPKDVTWIKLPRALVKDVFDKTAFSMSGDETRMNLNGVFFQVATDGKVLAVSTDGHRLSMATVDSEARPVKALSAIVHKRGVTEIKRILDGNEPAIDIGFGAGAVLFRAAGTTYMVRQIEDAFPDFKRVIPSGFPTCNAPREQLARAVRRIAMLSSNKTYVVKLEIGDGKAVVSASNPDYGEGRDEVDVEYSGAPMAIGFNYTYLLDVLAACKGEQVTIGIQDEFSPALITSPAEPGAMFVVMPMRV